MGHILTRDPAASRFHACERFDRCERVRVDGDGDGEIGKGCEGEKRGEEKVEGGGRKRVVYVNPVTMGEARWEVYLEDTRRRIGKGETVDSLVSTFLSTSSCSFLPSPCGTRR